MKILIADAVSPEAVEVLRSNGLNAEIRTGLERSELEPIIGSYEGLIVRSATKVDAGIIEKAKLLKVIGRAGIGVDNVDLEAATVRGIVVMNSPRGNALAAAEHTIGLMFALARKISLGDRFLKQGRWEKNLLTGVEVGGKTLGIIGFGNVGRIVATKARALDMKVIVYDPYVTAENSPDDTEICDLGSLLARSDFVSVHVPLVAETRHLLNGSTLAKVKKGAFIINAARGGIIDEAALYEVLENGLVAGAALDVFETEPPEGDDRLVLSDKVIATPHLGGSTREAQKKVAFDIANQIVDYFRNGVIKNSVNTPAVSLEMKKGVAPFVSLADRLARFVAHVNEEPIEKIEIEYRGAIADVATNVLTRQILSQIFGGPGEEVNSVNVYARMRSMGVEVKEFREGLHYYPTSLLVIRLKGKKGESAAYGTLLKENEARLIRLNNIPVDADLTGRILLVHCYDRPGLIGRVATRLAGVGINIGEMHFGRESVGGQALSLFDVDQAVDDATIGALRASPDIIAVKRIDLTT